MSAGPPSRANVAAGKISLWMPDPERALDQALSDTFPASDPVGLMPEPSRQPGVASGLPLPVSAQRLQLTRHMRVEQVFAAIAANCIQHIRANEVAVVSGTEMESLHQMRVGVRRLCSGFKLFGECFMPPQTMWRELQALQTTLGAARDWDVLLDQTLAALSLARPGLAGLAALRVAASEQRAASRQAVMQSLSSQDYTDLFDGLNQWCARRGWRQTLLPGERKFIRGAIDKVADKLLDVHQTNLLRRGRKLRRHDDEVRHRARIAAKKVRYDSEFLQSLYHNHSLRRYLVALKALQDELGALNDIAVAQRLLHGMAANRTELAACIDVAGNWLIGQARHHESRLPHLWREFKAVTLPDLFSSHARKRK